MEGTLKELYKKLNDVRGKTLVQILVSSGRMEVLRFRMKREQYEKLNNPHLLECWGVRIDELDSVPNNETWYVTRDRGGKLEIECIDEEGGE